MPISSQVSAYIERASWIRKMFETGARLKAEHGADKVFDFSLGNPDLPPPPAVAEGLRETAEMAASPLGLGYMPNSGYPDVREAVAGEASREQGVAVSADDVVMTCGAAGAINAVLKAVLDPGDEVVAPSPFFVEYGFYAENHGGVFKTAPCREPDFRLDFDALDAAVGEKTRAVIVNSPNNPTGAVYPDEDLARLGELLRAKQKAAGRPIYLLSDEPYRFLAFDGVRVPSVLGHYENSVVVNSFSKNLSLAGARIGYALLNPAMEHKDRLLAGIILANRILGFVNAPAIAQKVLLKAMGSTVDVSIYEARRAAMAEVLDAAGCEYVSPKGAFYFFPKAPGGDDVAFVNRLQEELILAVPGSGFGRAGHFRLTFCVDEAIIRNSAEGFKRAFAG